MKLPTFKQWLTESAAGNYLSLACELPKFKEIESLRSGKAPDETKSHITVMYSKNSSLDSEQLLRDIEAQWKPSYATIIGFDCFDGSEKGEDTGCIVAKVDCPMAEHLHQTLKVAYGLQHSYPQFAAHVTLAYDVDLIEARNITALLKEKYGRRAMKLTTGKLTSQTIDKNWSDKL